MTTDYYRDATSSHGLQSLRHMPWPAVLLLSLGVAAWLMLMQVGAMQYVPRLELGTWFGLALLAWGAGLWLVLLPVWALWLPAQLLDGPTVTSPWRGTLVALSGAALGALLLLVFTGKLTPIYVAFCVFVLVVLAGVRAFVIKMSVRHGLFIFGHDVLEMLMWALWGCLPWLAWLASGQGLGQADVVQGLAWLPLVLAVGVVALAHVPAVLQPRLRTMVWVLVVVLGLAWLSRPAVYGRWANGLLGLSVQNRAVTLVLTHAGCYAANTAFGKDVCWFEPRARQGVVRHARIVSHHGDQVVVQMSASSNKRCMSDEQVQATVWRRMVLKRDELIAWGQDVDATRQGCSGQDNAEVDNEPRG